MHYAHVRKTSRVVTSSQSKTPNASDTLNLAYTLHKQPPIHFPLCPSKWYIIPDFSYLFIHGESISMSTNCCKYLYTLRSGPEPNLFRTGSCLGHPLHGIGRPTTRNRFQKRITIVQYIWTKRLRKTGGFQTFCHCNILVIHFMFRRRCIGFINLHIIQFWMEC